MEVIYRPLAVGVKTVVRVMGWRVLVDNIEGIPRHGPVVVACNHVSYLDPIMVGLAVEKRGRLPRFMAKRELFTIPVFGAALRQMQHVPVDRQGAAAAAFPEGIARLQQGHLLALFPEATIRPQFDPANGKTGAARLAIESGAPLLPVGLWGGQAISTKGDKVRLRRRLPLGVSVGALMSAQEDEDAAQLTRRLMEQIGQLADHARAATERVS